MTVLSTVLWFPACKSQTQAVARDRSLAAQTLVGGIERYLLVWPRPFLWRSLVVRKRERMNMSNHFIYKYSPGDIEALERSTDFYNIFIHHEAAKNGILKIIDKVKLQHAIRFCRQQLANCNMTPLDYQPARHMSFDLLPYLPPSLVDAVQEISQETEFDHLTVTMATLGSISTALCGRYIIDCGNGWRESLSLYIMLIAPPGSKKSSLIARFKDVLSEVMREFQQEYDRTAPERRHAAKIKQKHFEGAVNEDVKAAVKGNRKRYKPGEFRQLMVEADEYAKVTRGCFVKR